MGANPLDELDCCTAPVLAVGGDTGIEAKPGALVCVTEGLCKAVESGCDTGMTDSVWRTGESTDADTTCDTSDRVSVV